VKKYLFTSAIYVFLFIFGVSLDKPEHLNDKLE